MLGNLVTYVDTIILAWFFCIGVRDNSSKIDNA